MQYIIKLCNPHNMKNIQCHEIKIALLISLIHVDNNDVNI